MTKVLVAVEFETRKANVTMDERIDMPADRPVEGAVMAAVQRLLRESFSQGFLREQTGPVTIKITPC